MKRIPQLILTNTTILFMLITSCSFLPLQNNQTQTPKFTVTIPATFTPIPPSTSTPTPYIITLTIPPIFVSTATETLIPSTVSISFEDSEKGQYLNISRSTDGLSYRLGPVAKGVYKVGPTDDFFVYCTNDGLVFAAKLGKPYLQSIGNVSHFTAIRRNAVPKLELKIFFNNGVYKVDVQEHRFGQNEIIVIPRNIAN